MSKRKSERERDSARRVVIYTRVSTAEQAREGLSLDVQRARCADYARALGLDVHAAFEDAGRSGRSLDRPGVLQALEAVRACEGALLVYALDRLTRSVRDLGALLDEVQAGAFELVSVTDNLNTGSAAGRLVVNVLGSVAQWQREAGAERVADALAHARESGARLGVLPLGLKRGTDRDAHGRLVVELDERGAELRALVEAAIRPWRASVGYRRGAFARAAAALNASGVRTLGGYTWRAESVRRVISSEIAFRKWVAG